MNLLDRLLSLVRFGKPKPKLVVVPQPIRQVVLYVRDGVDGNDDLVIDIGSTYVGLINIKKFLSEFRCGRGYEFIDNYIVDYINGYSGNGNIYLSADDMVDLTNKLREFGHKYEYNEIWL